MPYKATFTRTFTKEFDKLSKDTKEKILEAIAKVVDAPYVGTKLRGKLEGLWRWRIGKYRIIYLIGEKEKAVVFLDVGYERQYTNNSPEA